MMCNFVWMRACTLLRTSQLLRAHACSTSRLWNFREKWIQSSAKVQKQKKVQWQEMKFESCCHERSLEIHCWGTRLSPTSDWPSQQPMSNLFIQILIASALKVRAQRRELPISNTQLFTRAQLGKLRGVSGGRLDEAAAVMAKLTGMVELNLVKYALWRECSGM